MRKPAPGPYHRSESRWPPCTPRHVATSLPLFISRFPAFRFPSPCLAVLGREAAGVSSRGSPRSGTPDTAASSSTHREAVQVDRDQSHPHRVAVPAQGGRNHGGTAPRLPPPTHPDGFAVDRVSQTAPNNHHGRSRPASLPHCLASCLHFPLSRFSLFAFLPHLLDPHPPSQPTNPLQTTKHRAKISLFTLHPCSGRLVSHLLGGTMINYE
jgi:hypothetical protein